MTLNTYISLLIYKLRRIFMYKNQPPPKQPLIQIVAQ